jgi:hypothetical protein
MDLSRPQTTPTQRDADDPQAFAHRFAEVNGIDALRGGGARPARDPAPQLSLPLVHVAAPDFRPWPPPAFGSSRPTNVDSARAIVPMPSRPTT